MSNHAHSHAHTLGLLSLASGGAMLVAPRTMASIYAFPREPVALLRGVAIRDLLIGAGLLSARWRKAASVARALSDVADSALVTAHAMRTDGSVATVRGRILIGLASALLGVRTAATTRSHGAASAA